MKELVPHFSSELTVLQSIAEILLMEQLGEIGQRVQMLLKLALRHQKQHHQIDWFAVQRVKLNSFARTSNRPDHFTNQIGGRVWYSDAHPDASAH